MGFVWFSETKMGLNLWAKSLGWVLYHLGCKLVFLVIPLLQNKSMWRILSNLNKLVRIVIIQRYEKGNLGKITETQQR